MKRKTPRRRFQAEALNLIRDPRFLFRITQKIAELGVIGEKRNSLVLFLAGLTKDFEKPVSVLHKGESSTGKSELSRAVTSLFPPESVLARASLSKKAPAYGTDKLRGKILYITEYRGARDAMYLTRLLQSEGEIAHEYVAVTGHKRRTIVTMRKGSPVVFSTTTEQTVFQDDETRFLSLQADDSTQQTQQVIAAYFNPYPRRPMEEALPAWQEAIRVLCRRVPRFHYPAWFKVLSEHIPCDEPRARRDAVRFLSLLKAVGLCRSHSDGRIKNSKNEVTISFADYCVAYRILGRAFTSTFAGAHPQALKLARTVRRLNEVLHRPVSAKEIGNSLHWKEAVVYKYVKLAEKRRLVQYETGSHIWNLKRLLPGLVSRPSFLPDPKLILNTCPEVDDTVRYIDPLTGEKIVLRRIMRLGKAEGNARVTQEGE